MAVTTVDLHSAGASGEATGTSGGGYQDSYTCLYRVTVDDPLDGPLAVLTHFRGTPSLPWFGRRLNYGNMSTGAVVCRDVRARYVEKSEGQFVVEAKFDQPDALSEEGQSTGVDEDGKVTDDPLDWRDEITVAFTQYSEAMADAIYYGAINSDGPVPWLKPGFRQAVINSAGKPFDPLPETEKHIMVVRITRRQPRFDNFLFENFQGAINSDNFTIDKPKYRFSLGVDKHCGLLRLENAFDITNGIKNWRETKELWIHPRSWHKFILDADHADHVRPGDKDDDGDVIDQGQFPAARPWEMRTFTDGDGVPIIGPMLLNGRGRRLDPARPHCYLEYSDLEHKAFAGLDW